jgi:hypothetical protein
MYLVHPAKFIVIASWTLGILGPSHAAQPGPNMRCEVTYAGVTQEVLAYPVTNPYEVKPVDIGERFTLKIVMAAPNGKLKYVLIYAYLNQDTKPLLIQEAKYNGPFKASLQPYLLTGEQHLYAGPIERELIYRCWLGGVNP